MKELKTLLLFVLFFFLSSQFFAQQDEERLIQLSGIVVSSDSLEPMPFCNIYNKTTKTGTVGDYYGYFSIVSRPNDTLIFSYVGFKVNAYIIPDTLSTFTQGLVHLMERDTITGNTVTVYPWPSKEEFANAFITMNPYEDDIHRVQRELSGKNLAMLARNLPSDAGLSYSWQQQQNLNMLYNQGHRPVSNLLNPIAWMQFIKAWKDGKFKRNK
jgi:hypothetical protein